jgi:hypothetical protein
MNAEQPTPPDSPSGDQRVCRAEDFNDALGMPVIGCRLVPRGVSQHYGYEEHGLRLTPVSR